MATPRRAQRFGVTLQAFKGGFVDAAVMLEVAAAKRRSYLQAGGELVRRITSRTLKKAQKTKVTSGFRQMRNWPPKKPIYEPNPAPKMPAVRMKRSTGSPRDISKPLFRLDSQTRPSFVEIGPPKLTANPVPRLLERGGMGKTQTRRQARRIGGGGEVRVDRGSVSNKTGKTRLRRIAKGSRTTRKIWSDNGGYVNVTFAKIRTTAQLRRAQEFNDSLYAPSRPIRVHGRQYMKKILDLATTLPTNRDEWARKAKALFNGYLKAVRGQGRVRRYRA
jgi:hypothetical protein